MGFWHVYCGIYGGGGEVTTAPVDGWIAPLQKRHWIATVQSRVWSVQR